MYTYVYYLNYLFLNNFEIIYYNKLQRQYTIFSTILVYCILVIYRSSSGHNKHGNNL